jgi:hypothetical protein
LITIDADAIIFIIDIIFISPLFITLIYAIDDIDTLHITDAITLILIIS